MTLAALCRSNTNTPEQHQKAIWKTLAYIARYGRVPPSESSHWPNGDVSRFIEAISEVIEKEVPEDQ